MTDKEKLDKLVAEIERRITFFNKQSVRKTTTDDNSCALALQGVLCFYDSMQKEPQVKKLAGNQHVNETCKENGNSLTQEPVSEDLEKAAIQFATDTETGKVDVVKQSSFFWGAIYHKQQLMAKAVDGICISNGAECGASIESSAGMLFLQHNTFDVGDKVKIIIVRED